MDLDDNQDDFVLPSRWLAESLLPGLFQVLLSSADVFESKTAGPLDPATFAAARNLSRRYRKVLHDSAELFAAEEESRGVENQAMSPDALRGLHAIWSLVELRAFASPPSSSHPFSLPASCLLSFIRSDLLPDVPGSGDPLMTIGAVIERLQSPDASIAQDVAADVLDVAVKLIVEGLPEEAGKLLKVLSITRRDPELGRLGDLVGSFPVSGILGLSLSRGDEDDGDSASSSAAGAATAAANRAVTLSVLTSQWDAWQAKASAFLAELDSGGIWSPTSLESAVAQLCLRLMTQPTEAARATLPNLAFYGTLMPSAYDIDLSQASLAARPELAEMAASLRPYRAWFFGVIAQLLYSRPSAFFSHSWDSLARLSKECMLSSGEISPADAEDKKSEANPSPQQQLILTFLRCLKGDVTSAVSFLQTGLLPGTLGAWAPALLADLLWRVGYFRDASASSSSSSASSSISSASSSWGSAPARAHLLLSFSQSIMAIATTIEGSEGQKTTAGKKKENGSQHSSSLYFSLLRQAIAVALMTAPRTVGFTGTVAGNKRKAARKAFVARFNKSNPSEAVSAKDFELSLQVELLSGSAASDGVVKRLVTLYLLASAPYIHSDSELQEALELCQQVKAPMTARKLVRAFVTRTMDTTTGGEGRNGSSNRLAAAFARAVIDLSPTGHLKGSAAALKGTLMGGFKPDFTQGDQDQDEDDDSFGDDDEAQGRNKTKASTEPLDGEEGEEDEEEERQRLVASAASLSGSLLSSLSQHCVDNLFLQPSTGALPLAVAYSLHHPTANARNDNSNPARTRILSLLSGVDKALTDFKLSDAAFGRVRKAFSTVQAASSNLRAPPDASGAGGAPVSDALTELAEGRLVQISVPSASPSPSSSSSMVTAAAQQNAAFKLLLVLRRVVELLLAAGDARAAMMASSSSSSASASSPSSLLGKALSNASAAAITGLSALISPSSYVPVAAVASPASSSSSFGSTFGGRSFGAAGPVSSSSSSSSSSVSGSVGGSGMGLLSGLLSSSSRGVAVGAGPTASAAAALNLAGEAGEETFFLIDAAVASSFISSGDGMNAVTNARRDRLREKLSTLMETAMGGGSTAAGGRFSVGGKSAGFAGFTAGMPASSSSSSLSGSIFGKGGSKALFPVSLSSSLFRDGVYSSAAASTTNTNTAGRPPQSALFAAMEDEIDRSFATSAAAAASQ